MSKDRANLLCYLFIVATVAAAAWLYPTLPDPMPSHWNIDGEVDGYIGKPWGVALLPALPLFVFVVFRLIPAILPRGYRTGEFRGVVHIVQVTTVAFLAFVAFLVLFEAQGIDVRIDRMILAGLGVLFIVIGSCLGRVRKNFVLGIRTPWTLASDEVWNRTHRLAGRVFLLMGLACLGGAFFSVNIALLIALSVLLALVPVVYSYVLYRRLEGSDDAPDS